MRGLEAEDIFEKIVEIRRGLHRIPELSFEEEKTAAFVLEELQQVGIDAVYGGKGSGIIARLRGRDPGVPVIALRADMDALPGNESTGLPFASEHPGCVHACGHDAHMAMVLGAAHLLSRKKPSGDVVFLFQPAEERGSGALSMIRAGALEGVSAIFGGHVTHHYSTGQIMVAEGVVTAQSDRFAIQVQGKGGHGARPHEAVDAIVVAGFLISSLQTLVSRETDPLHPTVVTIGRIQAGTAANVIAEEALLEGTLRTTVPLTRALLHRGMRRMVEAAGLLYNAKVSLEISEGNPPVINTTREALICRNAAETVVGVRDVVPQEYPSMGSEDFAFYLHEVPGAYVRFGACKEGWNYVPLHSSSFTVDEGVLEVGASFFAEAVREAQRTLPRRA